MVHPNAEQNSMKSSRAIFDHELSNITGDILLMLPLVILKASTPDMGGAVPVDILRILIVIKVISSWSPRKVTSVVEGVVIRSQFNSCVNYCSNNDNYEE